MGLRSSGTVALFFDGCRVPADNLVGAPGGGYAIALGALGAGRIGIAAQCLGIAEAAMALGLSYVTERHAFGKRVADFQNTQFSLADCRLDIDAAWLLTLRAARLLDLGERARMESSIATTRPRLRRRDDPTQVRDDPTQVASTTTRPRLGYSPPRLRRPDPGCGTTRPRFGLQNDPTQATTRPRLDDPTQVGLLSKVGLLSTQVGLPAPRLGYSPPRLGYPPTPSECPYIVFS